MDRHELRDILLALALMALVVLPVTLYEMELGGVVARLVAAGVLIAASWAMSLGTFWVLARGLVLGISALLAGLLMLYGFDAVGGFEQVGL